MRHPCCSSPGRHCLTYLILTFCILPVLRYYLHLTGCAQNFLNPGVETYEVTVYARDAQGYVCLVSSTFEPLSFACFTPQRQVHVMQYFVSSCELVNAMATHPHAQLRRSVCMCIHRILLRSLSLEPQPCMICKTQGGLAYTQCLGARLYTVLSYFMAVQGHNMVRTVRTPCNASGCFLAHRL